MPSDTLNVLHTDSVFIYPHLSTRKSLTVVNKGGGRDVIREFKPFEMGMQVSCGIYPERAKEGVVREEAEVFRAGVSRVGTAEEESDRSRAYAYRSCAYADQYPAEVCGSAVIGYIKGKSAIAIARQFGGRKRNFSGERFWARGYAVSTVGFEEEKIRHYIRQQERFKKGYDKQGLIENNDDRADDEDKF